MLGVYIHMHVYTCNIHANVHVYIKMEIYDVCSVLSLPAVCGRLMCSRFSSYTYSQLIFAIMLCTN